jgi:hypothetical protein
MFPAIVVLRAVRELAPLPRKPQRAVLYSAEKLGAYDTPTLKPANRGVK